MKQGFFSQHWYNDDDIPSGGVSTGRGFTISWQNGALGRVNALSTNRHEPNGAFVEDIIDAALDRLNVYQTSKMCCDENDTAMRHLAAALEALDQRTKKREQRQVEGTHQV